MRIAVLGTGTGERERLPPAIAALASPGIEPVLINTRIEVFAHTQADRALVDLGHLDAAIGAEREGFDALFVNTFADYGLAGMKSALSIPVVGAGEAALQLAPVAPALQTRLPAPVIESSRAGYLATESRLRLGLTQSRLAYARPGDASLERLRRVLDAQDVTRTDASGENSEACPVCLPDER